MKPNSWLNELGPRLVLGAAVGAGIAAVDGYAFGGEITPIVIVGLLLFTAGLAGAGWGRRAFAAVAAGWVILPAMHLVRHGLGLPDTLHPNTYGSIAKLAGFSLAVSLAGVSAGLAVRRIWVGAPRCEG